MNLATAVERIGEWMKGKNSQLRVTQHMPSGVWSANAYHMYDNSDAVLGRYCDDLPSALISLAEKLEQQKGEAQ